jgi:DNA helicase IV
VLFVGPHQPYLSYVSDVLPSLGEEGVQTCTLRDLVREGALATLENDREVAQLKADVRMVHAIQTAIALYEKPPIRRMEVETPWGDASITAADWAEAFNAAEPGTSHNEARDQVWEALLDILTDKVRELDYDQSDPDYETEGDTERVAEDADQFDAYGSKPGLAVAGMRRAFAANEELNRVFARSWPLLEATDLVGDLWEDPALLRKCAPWLEPAEIQSLQREGAGTWTVSDLPLIDAARLGLGDPDASRLRRRQEAAVAAERERMAEVVDELIATDDSEMGIMQMLRGQDLRSTLVDEAAVPVADPDLLAGPFAHIVVDEAQELTDAEWQMLLLRCPSRSLTIVGDRAQARHGFAESWEARLKRVGLRDIRLTTLSINYRTPAEVMVEAERVIRAVLPDANVPTSIRESGVPVHYGSLATLGSILNEWIAEHEEGVACVIGYPTFEATPRIQTLSPELSKGLEFDLVVLVDPESFGEGIEGLVDRYVSMTRATHRLVILHS